VNCRALILDLGGVLIAEGDPVARRSWEARLGLDEGMLDLIVTEAVGPGWAGGRSELEIRERLGQLTGLSREQVEVLIEDFHAHTYLDPSLLAFIRAIRGRYRVATLSNAGPDQREAMIRKFDLDAEVDLMVISAEEGVQKPDPAIYHLTAARLAVEPAECIFVEDLAENTQGARAVGMKTITHVDSQTTLKALAALGMC